MFLHSVDIPSCRPGRWSQTALRLLCLLVVATTVAAWPAIVTVALAEPPAVASDADGAYIVRAVRERFLSALAVAGDVDAEGGPDAPTYTLAGFCTSYGRIASLCTTDGAVEGGETSASSDRASLGSVSEG